MKIFFKKNKFFTVKNINHFSIGHKKDNSFGNFPNYTYFCADKT